MTSDSSHYHRRRLLQTLGRLAKVTAVGGLFVALSRLWRLGAGRSHTVAPRVDDKAEFTFRPPGALAEQEFLARCIHCYLCQDVCPVGCIHMRADGESDRHTPYVLPRVKGCTLCLKCGDVCPTGALQPLRNKVEVRMGIAGVDENLCVSHLRTGACGACFTACPLRGRAITQGLYNAPTVHAEACTGCGLCEEVCIVPYRAIRVYPNAEIARASTGSLS